MDQTMNSDISGVEALFPNAPNYESTPISKVHSSQNQFQSDISAYLKPSKQLPSPRVKDLQSPSPIPITNSSMFNVKTTNRSTHDSSPTGPTSQPPINNQTYTSPYGLTNKVHSPNATFSADVKSASPFKATTSPLATKFSDVDSSTVQRQRRELQLMINELKDRDRELNEMVHSHHKQLVSWEMDRQRVLLLEKQNVKLKNAAKKRHEHCKLLKNKLKLSEAGIESKKQELESTQIHLSKLSERASNSTNYVEELKSKNETLEQSVQELSVSSARLQAKEQEATMLLKLKESDIKEANIRITQLSEKLRRTTEQFQESKRMVGTLRADHEKSTTENLALRKETDSLKNIMNESHNVKDQSEAELSQMKQQILLLQKELFLAGEREKRKDSLLELNRSKQERTESELNHVRELCERQHQNMVYLQQQVANDDDRLSFISASDYEGSSDTGIAVSMKAVADKGVANESFKNCSSQLSDSRMSALNDTLQSFSVGTCEDVGKMSTNELHNETSNNSFSELHNSNNSFYWNASKDTLKSEMMQNSDSSPTSRLHKLLEDSRHMMQELENSAILS